MKRFQKGFTIMELLFVLWFLIVLSALGGLVYVAWHFLSKFW